LLIRFRRCLKEADEESGVSDWGNRRFTPWLAGVISLPDADMVHVLANVRVWEKLRGRRVFLTGASGFVGTWLRQSFACANERLGLGGELVAVSRSEFPPGDFDFGIHAAKADDFRSDVELTRRSLEFAVQRGVTRLLFTSSGAVYGSLPHEASEDVAPSPETSYAKAKLAGELLCAEYGFATILARLFTFLGPGLPLDSNFAVGNFLRDAVAGGPIVIKGDGKARRSYLYAADLAIWLWTLLLEGESATPYNVGSPDGVSIAELAQEVVTNACPDASIVIEGGEVPGAGSVYVPSIDRARREFGLTPLIPLAEGIRRMHREMARLGLTRL
jgi:dTDP-glucose 4,6-dehydratase